MRARSLLVLGAVGGAVALAAGVPWGSSGCGEEEDARPKDPAAPAGAGAALDPSQVVERTEPTETAPPAAPARDREPNDGRETALPLAPDVEAVGYVDPPTAPEAGDEDWYVLEAPPGGPSLLRAEVSGAGDLDLVLEWMPPTAGPAKDRALVQGDVHVKSPGQEVLPNLRVEPGPVHLRVREAWYKGRPKTGSAVPYRIRATFSPWSEGVESEPDDDLEHAVPLPYGETGRGVLGHVEDRDVFRVPFAPELRGRRFRVAVTGVAGVSLAVQLLWPGAKAPFATGRGEAGLGISFRSAVVPEGAPGSADDALLVTVAAREGAAPEVAYELKVEDEEDPGTAAVETEPNDDPGAAMLLGGAGATVGWIDRPGDVDHLRLAVQSPTSLHVVLEAPLDLDLALELLGPDGDGRARLDEGRAGEAEVLRAFGVAPGPWTLVVRGHDRKVHDPGRAWSLEVRLADSELEEMEPNDEREAPALTRLGPGDDRRGWIHPRSDVDWWRLDLSAETAGRIVTFRVKPPTAVPLDVSVHGADGVRVTGRDGLLAPDASTFTHFLEPAVYGVRVSSREGASSSATDPYELGILE